MNDGFCDFCHRDLPDAREVVTLGEHWFCDEVCRDEFKAESWDWPELGELQDVDAEDYRD